MTQLFIYLLQVILSSGLLYGYYHFFLRNKAFHQYNRFYLLSATVLSLAIPFINIPVYFTSTPEQPSVMFLTLLTLSGSEWKTANVAQSAVQTATSVNFDWTFLIRVLYTSVAAILLIRLLVSLGKIVRLIRRHQIENLDQIRFMNTREPGTPFSFFSWLFWDQQIDLHTVRGEQIFKHEVYHIQQRHSWDVMFMEIIRTVCWINPFFHLMKKELRVIHEFLADKFAVSEDTKWEYAELLLMQALDSQQRLVTPFFHNQIKRRIAMITNPQKSSHRYLRKLLVLPLGALVLTLFAFKYKQEMIETADYGTPIVLIDPGTDNPGQKYLTVVADTVPDKYEVKEIKITAKSATEKNPVVFYGTPNLPEKRPLIVIDNKIQSIDFDRAIDTLNPENIKAINVLKNATAIKKYGSRGENGVIEFTTHGAVAYKEVPDTLPSVQVFTLSNVSEEKRLKLGEVIEVLKDKELKEVKVVGYATLASVTRDGQPLKEVALEPVIKGVVVKADGVRKKTMSGEVIEVRPDEKLEEVVVVASSKKPEVESPRESTFGLPVVYPNPANNTVNLKLTSETSHDIQIRLMDMNGKVVGGVQKSNVQKGTNTVSVDISSMKPGTYLIQVTGTGVKAQSFKLIKN